MIRTGLDFVLGVSALLLIIGPASGDTYGPRKVMVGACGLAFALVSTIALLCVVALGKLMGWSFVGGYF